MAGPQRIAFAKIGWSEAYEGDLVRGRAGWINANGDAHERFNFLRAPDGRYYGYLPPIGPKRRTPQPDEPAGWLVIFVAPLGGSGHLVPVGWFEDATFSEDYEQRPEYAAGQHFERDVNGDPYLYAIQADRGTLIPAHVRQRIKIPGRPYFGQTPVVYAAGYGHPAPWRAAYRKLALRVVNEDWSVEDKLSGSGGFADAKTAKAVEVAAVNAARQDLARRGYGEVVDRQKENCGYDLLARGHVSGVELHVEVKGTSGRDPRFFMTPNEHAYMADPRWRLAMVTDALGDPTVDLLGAKAVGKKFNLVPRVWEGRPK
jgi:hypothetical protein